MQERTHTQRNPTLSYVHIYSPPPWANQAHLAVLYHGGCWPDPDHTSGEYIAHFPLGGSFYLTYRSTGLTMLPGLSGSVEVSQVPWKDGCNFSVSLIPCTSKQLHWFYGHLSTSRLCIPIVYLHVLISRWLLIYVVHVYPSGLASCINQKCLGLKENLETIKFNLIILKMRLLHNGQEKRELALMRIDWTSWCWML